MTETGSMYRQDE